MKAAAIYLLGAPIFLLVGILSHHRNRLVARQIGRIA